jgi:hypothetical protein
LEETPSEISFSETNDKEESVLKEKIEVEN